jgi:RNA polymerase sigma-70 factor (ECF subfamily)
VAEEKSGTAERKQFFDEAMAQLGHIYRVASHLATESDEAQDLVQETYARAISSHDRFKLGSNMKAWLTKILYNLFFDRYHERMRWISIEQDISGETEGLGYSEATPTRNPGPENYTLLKELNSKIIEAIRKLPYEFRMPIILVDMEDFSYAEAAEVLSCPVGTIRSRMSRGRKLLHKYLKGYVLVGTK